ncbi:MAG TPA: HDIG domain-containing protein [Firmicutes bacterium]|nr:HDIG domain-containing protein [Bacillota bacterium]
MKKVAWPGRSLGERVLRTFRRSTELRRAALLALFGLLYAFLLGIGVLPESTSFRAGQVASRDVMSPRTIENRPLTQALREEAARQAELDAVANPANYEIDPEQARRVGEVIQALFARLETAGTPPNPSPAVGGNSKDEAAIGRPSSSAPDQAAPQSSDLVDEVWSQIRDELRIDLGRNVVGTALRIGPDRLKNLAEKTRDLVLPLMQEERISATNLAQVRELAAARADNLGLSRDERTVVSAIAQAVIRPNLALNRERVEQARAQAMSQVKPLLIQQGQVIVRRGDVITDEHIAILQDLGLLRGSRTYGVLLGAILFTAVLAALAFFFLRRHAPRVWQADRQFVLWGVILLLPAAMARLFLFVPWPGAGFLAPLALGPVAALLLFDVHLAVVAAIIDPLLVAGVAGWNSPLPVLALVSSLAWIGLLPRGSQRADITRVGVLVGVAAAGAMGGLALLFDASHALAWGGWSFLNGLATAVFTLGVLPYVESVFGLLSSIRLLELSHPTQTLLRRLMMEAPGTYHHSLMVGNLAEAAAEAIGADPLLVRVGAQYHDIGKIKRPYFFIENQFGRENPHDRLNPRLSALVLRLHVKDGVDLARQYRLPESIVDFIRQHHGTTLIPFFYQKALDRARETEDTVEEDDFRYPGPRPQSRETAIVMLADAVEAAIRAHVDGNRTRLEPVVRRIVRERLDDGQLDESDLTLRDLEGIVQAFLRVFNGMFHSRIPYPSLPAAGRTSQAERSPVALHRGAGGKAARGRLAASPLPREEDGNGARRAML